MGFRDMVRDSLNDQWLKNQALKAMSQHAIKQFCGSCWLEFVLTIVRMVVSPLCT